MNIKITAISLIFIIFAVLSLSFFMDNISIKEGFGFSKNIFKTTTTTTTPAPTTTTTPVPTTTKPITTTPLPTTTKPITTTPAPTTTKPIPPKPEPTPTPDYCTNPTIPSSSYYNCPDEKCQWDNESLDKCRKSTS